MTQLKAMFGASVLALATAPSAWADVSAADVWTQWKDYVEHSGQTMSAGSESMSGDTLTVSDLVISISQPEMSYSAKIGTVTLKENGDGTVTIGVPDSYPVELMLTPPDEAPVTLNLIVSQAGMDMKASGTPDAMSYAYKTDSLTIALDSYDAPDFPDTTMVANIALAGLAGTYDFGPGEPQSYESTISAQTLTVNLDINASPTEGGKFSLTAADISGTSVGALPAMLDYTDMSKALQAGFAVSGNLDMGQTSYTFDYRGNADSMSSTASMTSAGISFAMSSEGMSYGTKSTGLDVSFSGSDIPLPQLRLKLAETGFGLTMPVAKSETPQDVALLVRLVGLEVEDVIWGMIDPTGQLPHDPATLIVDLKGTANWLVDIMSPDAESQMGSMGMPGELHTLDIDELELTAIGASLTGTGGFTFDNTDMMTWGGMPAPDGTVNLQLVGANALIDKLVAMGLLPQDQAMGAKMMMGLFAKPGNGPDTLTSEIKVTKDGHIFANGQQLQ